MSSQIDRLAGENPKPPLEDFPSFNEFIEKYARKKNKTLTNEEIIELRKPYKKLYFQNYYRLRKKKEHRLTIRLTNKEHVQLKTIQKKHDSKSMSTFIKSISFAYLSNQYVPRNTKQMEQLKKEINSIGTNINQVVHSIHRHFLAKESLAKKNDAKVLLDSYNLLHKKVEKIQEKIETSFSSPPLSLEEALEELIQIHPDKIDTLIKFLESKK